MRVTRKRDQEFTSLKFDTRGPLALLEVLSKTRHASVLPEQQRFRSDPNHIIWVRLFPQRFGNIEGAGLVCRGRHDGKITL